MFNGGYSLSYCSDDFQESTKESADLFTILRVLNLKRPLSLTAASVAPMAIVSLELVVLDGCISNIFSAISTNLGILEPPPTNSTESILMLSL